MPFTLHYPTGSLLSVKIVIIPWSRTSKSNLACPQSSKSVLFNCETFSSNDVKCKSPKMEMTEFEYFRNVTVRGVCTFGRCNFKSKKTAEWSGRPMSTDDNWDANEPFVSTMYDLNSAIYLSVKGAVTSLPVFIENILNCVPKTNKAFVESERHAG